MTPLVAAFVLLFVLTGAIGALSRTLAGGKLAPPREKRSGMLLGLVRIPAIVNTSIGPS